MSGYPINDEIEFALDIEAAKESARRAEKREVASGEDVANRGAALNARLGSLPDQAQGEHETNKTKEKTK